MDINQIIEHLLSIVAIIISLIELWDRRRDA